MFSRKMEENDQNKCVQRALIQKFVIGLRVLHIDIWSDKEDHNQALSITYDRLVYCGYFNFLFPYYIFQLSMHYISLLSNMPNLFIHHSFIKTLAVGISFSF